MSLHKVLLVVANTQWLGGMPMIEPLMALPILAAELSGKFDYDILDLNGENLSEEYFIKSLKDSHAEAVLLPGIFIQYHTQYHKVMELAKATLPQVVTVMGGIYPTTCYEKVMEDPNVDYAFLGYAETRLSKFVELILENKDVSNFAGICYRSGGQVKVNPVDSYIGDLKELPSPNYEKVNLWPYMDHGHVKILSWPSVSLMTSYGCPHNCAFCANKSLKGCKIIYRDVEDVIREVKYLVDTYSVHYFSFDDDNMLTNKRYAKQFFTRLIEEDLNIKFFTLVAAWNADEEVLALMAKAGCYECAVPLESGSPRVLRDIIHKPLKREMVPRAVKMCRDLGIYTGIYTVIGLPGETWDEIRETISYGQACNPDHLFILIATPLPKTDLYKMALEQGCLPKDFDFFDPNYKGFSTGFITTDEFTPMELEVLRAFEWDRVNFATEEQRQKYCEHFHLTPEELDAFRKDTRLNFGKSWGLRKAYKNDNQD